MANSSPTNEPGYFQRYINLVPQKELAEAFAVQLPIVRSLLERIDENQSGYSYAPGKWTLKELLQHMIDTERIFCYRALCFARKDKTPLPGFDENDYADNAKANERSWQNLVAEFFAVRRSTEILFESFNEETLLNIGVASVNMLSVQQIGAIILGHCYHHQKIMEERYL